MIPRYGLTLLLLLLSAPVWADRNILVFGDSLSAAYGIPRESGWANLLGQQLAGENPAYRVVNASISGETTSGGLSRIATALNEHKPAIVIIELGANDGLRGLPVADTRKNLTSMIEACRRAKSEVVLIGMRIPPNYGIQYAREFSNTFSDLAAQYRLKLVPFLLEGVAGNPELIQPDGLHPTAAAQPRILDNVWPSIKALLRR